MAMDNFQFPFTWKDEDHTAQCQVSGNDDRQKFLVTVDDEGLQGQFGKELTFTWLNKITFSWDSPDGEEASAYMKAVNMGLLEYLDEHE